MDWNTHFAQMMGDATEMMYGTHLLNATEAMQRVLIGAPLALATPAIHCSPHSSLDVLEALLPERQASAAAHPLEIEAPDSFQRVPIMVCGVLHHYWLYVPPGAAAEAADDTEVAEADDDAEAADGADDTEADTEADAPMRMPLATIGGF